ncbi:MAG: ABC transporter permease subunit, partial [Deltaproteobacteria bacterium]|nr:ABC transporter permease subunit [Deltaproteobacteria bacterium]
MSGPIMETPSTTTKPRPARTLKGASRWLRENLFSSGLNSLLTLFALWVIYKAAYTLVTWGILHAAFGSTPESCQGIQGACWSFVYHFFGLFLVGTYPYDQRWRILGVLLVVVALSLATMYRPWRGKRWLILGWIASLLPVFLLIRGSEALNLEVVDSTQWGGLMLTLLLSVFGVGLSFPFSILLALGRRSKLPVIKALCVGYIELIRGVPLITILFMASVMLPLFFPPGFNLDKVLRAQLGIMLFSSAYL